MSDSWSAEAPSNIALIKYMGKTGTGNNPANVSLSYTLPHLRTRVEVTPCDGEDQWKPLDSEEWTLPSLSEKGQERYLNFWRRLKQEFKLSGNYLIRSGNNFPSDCGLASSASSFAALTQAAHRVFLDQVNDRDWSAAELANLSRQGSGSSCRSFFAPWSFWDPNQSEGKNVGAADFGDLKLQHNVIVVAGEKKEVSSSEAHKRVPSSLIYKTRVERAQQRYSDLVSSLKSGDWGRSFETTWSEFWDMHALFETSDPNFGYMTAGSLAALGVIRKFWRENGDGPLVTMDAGPNIHLLFRDDQNVVREQLLTQLQEYKVL